MSALVVEVDRRKTYIAEGGRRLVLAERFPPVPFRPQIEADGWIQSIETAPAPSTAVLSHVNQSIAVKHPEAPGLSARVLWGTSHGFREPVLEFHMEDVHVVVAPLQVDAPSIDILWLKDDEAMAGFVGLRIYRGLATMARDAASPAGRRQRTTDSPPSVASSRAPPCSSAMRWAR